MKKRKSYNRVAFRAALFFLVISVVWVWATNLIFRPSLTSDLILVCLITVLIFFIVKLSRRFLARMTREYKSLFETHPSPMWIVGTDSLKFLEVNQAAVKQYGYSKNEFLQMTILDIRPAEDRASARDYLTDPTPRQMHETVWKHLKKDGAEIIVKTIASDVTFKRGNAKLVEANDITELVGQQEKIREMSLVAQNTTNGVILSDGEGRIKWVNKAFEQTTGYQLNEVQGKFPRSFLHGPLTDKQVEKTINELAREQKGFTGDLVNYKKDGTPYWVHLNLSPVVVNGKIENIVVIQTDITELKQQSEKITDQYRRLKEMSFMTSHNARSQLTNILGLCAIIADQSHDSEQKALTGYLKESATKLDEVMHTIVEHATSQ
ncbi:MAG: PAS domain-containing protein [Bacteroidota bacterium]